MADISEAGQMTSGAIAPRNGLIRVVSPDQLTERDAMRQAEADRNDAQRAQTEDSVQGLSAHLQTCWEAAHNAKETTNVKDRLLQCLYQRRGEYMADKLADIRRFGGSEVFMMLTNVKCRAVESWVRDILMPPGEKPWSIDPTPVPDMPRSKQQEIDNQLMMEVAAIMTERGSIESVPLENIEARRREIENEVEKEILGDAKEVSDKMEKRIEDDLQQGGYYRALSQFITDIATYMTAFLKGPIIRKKKTMVWTEDQFGRMTPAIEERFVRCYERASPFDMYPSPGAKHIQDGYLIQRHRLRRSDLQEMIGVEGFNEQAIRAALYEYGRGGLTNWLWDWDQERAEAEGRSEQWSDPDKPIDALEYWGTAQGALLLEWGMDPAMVPDPMLDYQITAWKVGNWIICARLNPHPLGRRPYYAASFENVVDSIWGTSVPELMEDIQDICNGVARAIVNNLGIASGPQVAIEMDRVDPGEDVEDMWPWKIWKVKSDPNGGSRPAIQFFQPNPITEALMRVYEYFFQQASEQTGVPAYIYGSAQIKGAGETASGLAMLLNAASKSLKAVVAHVDESVIKETIHEHWTHLMLYDEDNSIKQGDINIIARASEYMIIQEQLQLRRMEFLRETANNIDYAIMGKEGRAVLLREQAKGLKLPSEDIVPTKEQMRAQDKMLQEYLATTGGLPENANAAPGGPQTPRPAPLSPSGGRMGGEEVRYNA